MSAPIRARERVELLSERPGLALVRAPAPRNARLLIIDDHDANIEALKRILRRAGFASVNSSTDPRVGVTLAQTWSPDLILLDLHMPGLDGFGVLDAIRPQLSDAGYLPVLMLTADSSDETKQRALSGGVKDFLTKPFDPTEVVLRIENLLETRFLYGAIREQNQVLEQRVVERTRELEEAQIEILQRLAAAAEFRDDDTGQHTQRVGHLAALLAAEIGLASDRVELIRRAAPLHDVGKIGIPDAILLKRGRLTSNERRVMQTHTTIGATMLTGGRSPLVQMAELIARSHHERWDGKGYPTALRKEQIAIEARLVAVVDYLDALTHDRPYRKAWSLEKTLEALAAEREGHFDPTAVDALLAVVRAAPPLLTLRST
ncbi:MAG TPA: HD domain-containing phosphohydrolase [Gemmatimonadaceae bacterium]|jgi:putative two-component system response regulator